MSDDAARDELIGRKITAAASFEDFLAVHFEGDATLTGYTRPFGNVGCGGVNETTIRWFVGKRVDGFEIQPGRYIAIDSREIRLAFPIDEVSMVGGPEAARLYVRGVDELGLPAKHWIW